MTATIHPARDARQLADYHALASQVFRDWLPGLRAVAEQAVTLVAVEDGTVIGGATGLPFAHFFGGRPVPAAGVAAVCLAPHARGRGVAGRLLDELVTVLCERGAVLVSLWTPAPGVYRRRGWEVMAPVHRWRLPTRDLAALGAPGHWEPAGHHRAAVEQMQRDLAARWDGPLQRPGWWWRWNQAGESYALIRDRSVAGFVAYDTVPAARWTRELVIGDFWAVDDQATRALYRFLGGHASTAETVVFSQGAAPPAPGFVFDLPYDVTERLDWHPWMLRVCDPVAALEHRGWPPAVDGTLELTIEGPGGPRPVAVKVSGGEATVIPGGDGRIHMSTGQFTRWYGGGAAQAGGCAGLGVDAAADDLLLLDALVPGRGPWLPDVF